MADNWYNNRYNGNHRHHLEVAKAKAFFTNAMTYREAVKVAKLEAQKKGTTIIYVLP